MNPPTPTTIPGTESRPPRCPPETAQLWKRYAGSGHGSPAEVQLVEQHLPLVRTVVGRVAMSLPPHVDAEDLHSAGMVGLLNAVRRYDAASGVAFETYARLRIRGAVLDELRRLDWVPRSLHKKARKVQEVMMRLEQDQGGVPSEEAMAAALGLSCGAYRELLTEIRPATFVCLDSVRAGDGDDGVRQAESISNDAERSPSDQTAIRELSDLVAQRITQLPEMQRKVLALYYFEDLRLREIAAVFGVTESRICQIHAQAILALKAFLRRHDPEASLDG
ncbi:MAG: FliA/WhiG family RNA polymerase sigma factor [Limisphaerales bacterium]